MVLTNIIVDADIDVSDIPNSAKQLFEFFVSLTCLLIVKLYEMLILIKFSISFSEYLVGFELFHSFVYSCCNSYSSICLTSRPGIVIPYENSIPDINVVTIPYLRPRNRYYLSTMNNKLLFSKFVIVVIVIVLFFSTNELIRFVFLVYSCIMHLNQTREYFFFVFSLTRRIIFSVSSTYDNLLNPTDTPYIF